jgi:opacity protein-like surface antigen
MKKNVLVLLFVALTTISVSAQSGEGFAKGDIFVSGAFGYESTNNKNTDFKTSYFEIAPSLNYFVTENISLGGKIGYEASKSEFGSTIAAENSTLTLGVMGRYYMTPADKFSVYGNLGVEYVSLNQKLPLPEQKVNGFGAGLGFGINYFLSSNFSIEAAFAALEFASAKSDAPGAKAVTGFDLGFDLSKISFGVNYKF